MLGTRNRCKSGDGSLPDSDIHDLTDSPSGKRMMPDKENGIGQKKKKVTTPAQIKRKANPKQPTKAKQSSKAKQPAKQLTKSTKRANPEPDSLESDSPKGSGCSKDLIKPAELADLLNASLSFTNSDTSCSSDDLEEEFQ